MGMYNRIISIKENNYLRNKYKYRVESSVKVEFKDGVPYLLIGGNSIIFNINNITNTLYDKTDKPFVIRNYIGNINEENALFMIIERLNISEEYIESNKKGKIIYTNSLKEDFSLWNIGIPKEQYIDISFNKKTSLNNFIKEFNIISKVPIISNFSQKNSYKGRTAEGEALLKQYPYWVLIPFDDWDRKELVFDINGIPFVGVNSEIYPCKDAGELNSAGEPALMEVVKGEIAGISGLCVRYSILDTPEEFREPDDPKHPMSYKANDEYWNNPDNWDMTLDEGSKSELTLFFKTKEESKKIDNLVNK